MKKLSREQANRLEEISKDLLDARTKLKEAIETFNEVVQKLWVPISNAADEVNAILSDANDFRTEMLDGVEMYRDSKSDNWKESDEGISYQEWINSWEDVNLEDVDLNEPEAEFPDMDEFDVFEDLPQSPDEV